MLPDADTGGKINSKNLPRLSSTAMAPSSCLQPGPCQGAPQGRAGCWQCSGHVLPAWHLPQHPAPHPEPSLDKGTTPKHPGTGTALLWGAHTHLDWESFTTTPCKGAMSLQLLSHPPLLIQLPMMSQEHRNSQSFHRLVPACCLRACQEQRPPWGSEGGGRAQQTRHREGFDPLSPATRGGQIADQTPSNFKLFLRHVQGTMPQLQANPQI